MDEKLLSFLEYKKKYYIKAESRSMFNNLLGIKKGKNFKKNIPLNELITEKINDESNQFKLYVGIIDYIIDYCWILFNLDISDCNITMDLTANQIMFIIQEKYLSQEKKC